MSLLDSCCRNRLKVVKRVWSKWRMQPQILLGRKLIRYVYKMKANQVKDMWDSAGIPREETLHRQCQCVLKKRTSQRWRTKRRTQRAWHLQKRWQGYTRTRIGWKTCLRAWWLVWLIPRQEPWIRNQTIIKPWSFVIGLIKRIEYQSKYNQR